MKSPDNVKTAARTLDLFESFATAKEPLTLSEISKRINAPISSCHALIRTLQDRGYVYAVGTKRRFYPTRRLLDHATAITTNDPVLEKVRPALERLRQASRETVVLGKGHGKEVLYLEVLEGLHIVRYAAQAGDSKPMHSSSIGKALLAAHTPEERAAVLDELELYRVTSSTITDRAELERYLDRSAKLGYYATRGENVVDVMAMAVPVRIGSEHYGLAIAGPLNRMEANEQAAGEHLLRARHEIEAL